MEICIFAFRKYDPVSPKSVGEVVVKLCFCTVIRAPQKTHQSPSTAASDKLRKS